MAEANLSNNNNVKENPDLELLAKLQEANRLLEADKKSLQSLAQTSSNSSPSTKSLARKCSSSSVASSLSQSSHFDSSFANDEDDVTNESLWDTWGYIVNDWENAKRKTSYLANLVRYGIPHHFRSLAWQRLTNAYESPAKTLYIDYLRNTSPNEKQIRRDIARTFPDHDFFKDKNGLGQESLFNVMKAYSLHDREVGYCQGSGFIVGLLLMQMPEEEAFAIFVKLMQEYRLRELFTPSMAELGLCMFQLENMIQDLLPEMHMHFNSQGFHTSMYASTWFLTLFVTTLPLSMALRIMDLFVVEGMEVIFRIGMAILEGNKDDLLSMDMEAMLNFFQKILPTKYGQESEADALIHDAFLVKYNSKKMKKLEKDYTVLKTKEQEEQIELRRLRTENRLLRQRIDNLEKESSDLADKLIHYQVIRAQEAEETFILKNDLSSVRQKSNNAAEKLSQTQLTIDSLQGEVATLRSENAALQNDLESLQQKAQESASIIEELQGKVVLLDDTNKELQRAPTNDVQQLQEDLIAAKLREAEANLALKELKQKVHELDLFWTKHFEANKEAQSPKDKKHEVKSLEEELISIKLREAQCLTELKEAKLRIMDLETQNQISTNQIRRMTDSLEGHQDKVMQSGEVIKEQNTKIKELERKISDLETAQKEESMMTRIKEMEQAQVIESLRQKIVQLEIENEEMAICNKDEMKTDELGSRIDYDDDDQENIYHNPPFESTRNSTMSSSMMMSMDEDELALAVASTDTLNRTLSDIIEGLSSMTEAANAKSDNSSRSNSDNKTPESSHVTNNNQPIEDAEQSVTIEHGTRPITNENSDDPLTNASSDICSSCRTNVSHDAHLVNVTTPAPDPSSNSADKSSTSIGHKLLNGNCVTDDTKANVDINV